METSGMMTPAGLILGKGTRLPDNWKMTGGVKDYGGRTVLEPTINVLGMAGSHVEKSYGVTTMLPNGQNVVIVSGGEDFTEDIKDQARRLHEEAKANAVADAQRHKEEAEAKRQQYLDFMQQKVDYHRKNPISFPDPGHTKGRRAY